MQFFFMNMKDVCVLCKVLIFLNYVNVIFFEIALYAPIYKLFEKC